MTPRYDRVKVIVKAGSITLSAPDGDLTSAEMQVLAERVFTDAFSRLRAKMESDIAGPREGPR